MSSGAPASEAPDKDPRWIAAAQVTPGAERFNARVASVLLLCFAMFCAGGTAFYVDQAAFIDAPTVPAHLTDRSVSKSSGKNSSTSYYLSYTYEVDGVEHEGRSSVSHDLYSKTFLSKKIPVHVDPDDPTRSEADPSSGLRISQIFLGLFGAGFLLALYLSAAAWAAARARLRPDAPTS